MLPALQGAHSIKTKMYVFIVSHRTPDAKVIAPIPQTGKPRRRALCGSLKHKWSLTAIASLNSCLSVLCRMYELKFLEKQGDGTRVGAATRVPSDKWQVTFMSGVGRVYPVGNGRAWTNRGGPATQKGLPSLAPEKCWRARWQTQHHQVF